MIRETLVPRPQWRDRLEAVGFDYHTIDGTYWDESRCYRLTEAEVDQIEAATAELHARCLEAAHHVVATQRYAEFGIRPDWIDLVERSLAAFTRGDTGGFSLLGRMDLVCDAAGPPRLLEYNADTPTSCLEASVAQWQWLQDLHPQADQFNSLHEKLIEGWQRLRGGSLATRLHLAAASLEDGGEDGGNLRYLRDTATQAGWQTTMIEMEAIGHDGIDFVDAEGRPMEALFKLYPWEWMAQEDFGDLVATSKVQWLEPPWKMLLSNKAILVVLWELFPGHPNLLPAYYEPERLGARYARKPRLSREGANVLLVDGQSREQAAGPYDESQCVYQALAPLPRFGDDHLVVGSWIIDGRPAGIGMREDRSAITRDTSRFVPHYFT